jgi:hypothetical protein
MKRAVYFMKVFAAESFHAQFDAEDSAKTALD